MAEIKHPNCEQCDEALVCTSCDDTRPTADLVYAGYKIFTPFRRWETVTRVERGERGIRITVFTQECGPDYGWPFYRWDKIKMIAPEIGGGGVPIIKIVGYQSADAMIQAVCSTESYNPGLETGAALLCQATFIGKGKGWYVVDRTGENRSDHPSKAAARVEVHRRARAAGKAMKIKVVLK